MRRYCHASLAAPRLSIVIPFLGDLKRLEETLVSVLENRPDECQVIVVPNELYDDPYDLKDEVCFVQAPPGASLVTSANLGICASRAPIVHLLACGTKVGPGWADCALAHFEDPQVGAVAPLVLKKDDPQRVVTLGVEYRSAGVARQVGQEISVTDLHALDQGVCGPDTRAAFYRKSALDLVGQFAPEIGDGLAGLDLAMRLQQAGFHCVSDRGCVVSAEPEHPCSESSYRRGVETERFFWRWAPQRGWIRSLSAHAALLSGEFIQSLRRPATVLTLMGRLVGGLQMTKHRRHWCMTYHRSRPRASMAGVPHFSASPGRAKRLESLHLR